MLEQSKRVNESLKRTRQVLNSQLTNLSDAMISLSSQKDTLKKTFDEHESISGELGTSQKLIIWLRLKERWDHYATIASVWLFALVVASIINKRVFPFFQYFL